jgi:hypothetical protein
MHRERQQHAAVKKRCAPTLERACLPAIKVTAAEGFFFFGLFRPTVARLIWATPAEMREVRHVFKDTGLVFWENRVRPAAQGPRSRAPLSRKRGSRQSILVSSRNSADTSADHRTRYRCGWWKQLAIGKKILREVSSSDFSHSELHANLRLRIIIPCMWRQRNLDAM